MNLKKSVMYILIVVLVISMIGCGVETPSNNETENGTETENATETENSTDTKDNIEEEFLVAVSIVPQETFVKAVAGDLVDVVTMIPPGYSPANYQPNPKQMAKFSVAEVYFSIGVPTEEANILPNINDFNKDIKVVALPDIVGEVYPHRYFREDEHHDHEQHDHEEEHHEEEHHEEEQHDHEEDHHHHSGKDPHIWLSPKRAKIMVEVIKDELVKLDPNNKSTYEKNASEYIAKLDQVDNEINDTLAGIEKQSFIIYHPSFGYFADDYGLKMVTIEEEGKEATSKKLQSVIDFAKKENIKFVFYQEEFDSSQAETIAKEIGGATVKVAPLSPNYIENLRLIANKFKEVLK